MSRNRPTPIRTLRWGNTQALSFTPQVAFPTAPIVAQVIRTIYDVPLTWTLDLYARVLQPDPLGGGQGISVFWDITQGVGSGVITKRFSFFMSPGIVAVSQDYNSLSTNKDPLEAYVTLELAAESINITPSVLAISLAGTPVSVTLAAMAAPRYLPRHIGGDDIENATPSGETT
jgi:hypothetical protein